MSLTPRRYQIEACDAFRAADPSIGQMFVVATGCGKTATAHILITEALERGERVVWVAHQNRLVTQPFTSALMKYWPQYADRAGFVANKHNEVSKQLLYCSMQTLARPKRMAQVLEQGPIGLLVVDEAHHAPSAAYSRVIAELRGPNTRMLGLTATPDREDNKRLSEMFQVCYSYSITDALSEGSLLPPYVAVDRVKNLDLRDVGGRKDYTSPDLARALLKAHIVEHTVKAIGPRSEPRVHVAKKLPFLDDQAELSPSGGSFGGGLVFTATVEQAKQTAIALRAAGWRAEYISGEKLLDEPDENGKDRVAFPMEEREALMEAFDRGDIDILCNAQLLTEGVDLPRAAWCVLARPTKSWSLFVQMVGRVLRLFGEQDKALVLDLVGCTDVHSIVAAPVLVDGADCPDSQDGQHRYLAIEGTGEGRCHHCGHVCKCFARLAGHRFVDGKCRGCGAIQCEKSPTKEHDWVPWEEGTRQCCHCMLEMPDPTAQLMKPPKARERLALHKLDLPGEVWACNLGRHGVLFNVAANGKWMPVWCPSMDRMLRLSPRPVDGPMSRALLEDVARRANKVAGAFGGAETPKKAHRLAIDATLPARIHKVWTLGM